MGGVQPVKEVHFQLELTAIPLQHLLIRNCSSLTSEIARVVLFSNGSQSIVMDFDQGL